MNMKKTIAAIAAGAVAVSAMATTVSALEARELTYNLVHKVSVDKGNGVITAFFSDVDIREGDVVKVYAVGGHNWDTKITLSGSYYDEQGNSTKTINPIVITNMNWEEGYSIEGSKLGDDTYAAIGAAATAYVASVPVVAKTAGTAVSLVESPRANIQVQVKYTSLTNFTDVNGRDFKIDSTGALNTAIANAIYGVKFEVVSTKGRAAETADNAKSTFKVKSQTLNDTEVTIDDDAPAATYTYTAGAAATALMNTTNVLDSTKASEITAETEGTWTYTAGGWTNPNVMTAYQRVPGVDMTLVGTPSAGAAPTFAASDKVGTIVTAITTPVTVTATTLKGLGFSDAELAALTTSSKVEILAGKAYAQADTTIAGTDAVTVKIGTVTKSSTVAAVLAASGTKATAAGTDVISIGDKIGEIAVTAAGTAATTITTTKAGTGTWSATLDGVTIDPAATISNGDQIIVTAGTPGGTTKPAVAAGAVAYSSVTVGVPSGIVGAASSVGAGADVKEYPFLTTIDNNRNVLGWITDSNGNYLSEADVLAVTAVINDAVANYSDVVFQFNTAAKNVKFEIEADGTVKDENWGYYTDDSATSGWKDKYKLDNAVQVYDGQYKVTNYTEFGRHFWDKDLGYGADTTYIKEDWYGNNLFSGALIINKQFTLSLATTDKFDWTDKTLSFSWDAIQDTANERNNFVNYIQSMVLRTSADWYWDKMVVVLGATEAEEVDTTSPIEGEDEDLPEDEADLDAEVDEEPDEEPEEEPEAEEEPEVAPIAESPKTGNAPVALAVIPVALAAAAVVAKKRG